MSEPFSPLPIPLRPPEGAGPTRVSAPLPTSPFALKEDLAKLKFGKQDKLSDSQMLAVNSGITAEKVGKIGVISLDDSVTQQSSKGVKSSGIWLFAKGLLPSWLTPSFAEPLTEHQSLADYAKTANVVAKGSIPSWLTPSFAKPLTEHQSLADYAKTVDVVAKENGKGLSTNDFTQEAKNDLNEVKSKMSGLSGKEYSMRDIRGMTAALKSLVELLGGTVTDYSMDIDIGDGTTDDVSVLAAAVGVSRSIGTMADVATALGKPATDNTKVSDLIS